MRWVPPNESHSLQRRKSPLPHQGVEPLVSDFFPASKLLQADLIWANAVGLALVLGLLLLGSPTNIPGFVVPIDLDSVDGVLWGRAWANVSQKGREVVEPAVAHRDAAGAVGVELPVRRGVATGLSVAPRLVLRRWTPIDCCAVGERAEGRQFSSQATATGRKPTSKWLGTNDGLHSTVTEAAPHSATSCVSIPEGLGSAKYGEPAVSLSSQIQASHDAELYRIRSLPKVRF